MNQNWVNEDDSKFNSPKYNNYHQNKSLSLKNEHILII